MMGPWDALLPWKYCGGGYFSSSSSVQVDVRQRRWMHPFRAELDGITNLGTDRVSWDELLADLQREISQTGFVVGERIRVGEPV